MTKKKRKFSNEWKPVNLEGPVCSKLEGLVGIEELTDYRLENSRKRSQGKLDEIVKLLSQQKNAYVTEDDEFDKESDEEKPKIKKVKQKRAPDVRVSKKKAKLGAAINTDSVFEPDNNSDRDNIDCNEDVASNINVHAWATLGVPAIIIKALADEKFDSPTVIQSLTLAPAILGRRDILGAAETGSGKTLAFGIPILNGILKLKETGSTAQTVNTSKEITQEESVNDSCSSSNDEDDSGGKEVEDEDLMESDTEEDGRVSDEEFSAQDSLGCVRVIDDVQFDTPTMRSDKPLYALILTPTRELAIQIKDHLIKAAKYTDIKIAVVVGGMAAVKQERILSKGPEIVIATPGRLWELIQQGNAHLNQLDSIKYLAIDETDRMLEQGHFQELYLIIEKINSNPSKVTKRQTFVFSATLTMVHDVPDYLQRKKWARAKSKIAKLTPGKKLQNVINLLKMENPKIVDITKEKGTAGNLTECRIACTIDHKDYYLYYFLKRHSGRTLVFCNSIGCVKRLATLFNVLECNPLPLHANMQQRQRLKNLERFQADENGVLIATDVAARGLDIPNVEHVIHYQVPRTSESYVHRSGRTARAEKEGITVLMMEPTEKQNYSKLCKTLGRTHDLPTFPVIDSLLTAVKDRVDVAREIDSLDLKCRRDSLQKGWFQKAIEDMDVILDEDEYTTAADLEEMAHIKRQLKAKRRQLAMLLAKPIFPKGFSGRYFSISDEFQLGQSTQKAVDVMKSVIKETPDVEEEQKPTPIAKKQNRFWKKGKKKPRKT